MILGIGTDIVSIGRIEDLMQQFGEKFSQKIFTQHENEVAAKIIDANKSLFYAKRFAAKEAFSKACGLGIGRGIDFLDIEVINDSRGKPSIKILNNKNDFLESFFQKKFVIHLSLSDEKPLAQAIVIIENL